MWLRFPSGERGWSEILELSPIIGAAIEVHKQLGPGLSEFAYDECLCHELHLRGIQFQRQLDLPVLYKWLKLDCGYQLDLLVEDTVVVELKAVEQLLPVHEAQLLTYLRWAAKPVGLLINFNVPLLKGGIRQRVYSDGSLDSIFLAFGFSCVSVPLW